MFHFQGPNAVSYTHLDVYKRQEYSFYKRYIRVILFIRCEISAQ